MRARAFVFVVPDVEAKGPFLFVLRSVTLRARALVFVVHTRRLVLWGEQLILALIAGAKGTGNWPNY